MAPRSIPSKGIKGVVWIGGICIFLIAIVTVGIMSLRPGPAPLQEKPAENTTTNGLGEKGSACGGPMRLPCKPGLSCETEESGGLGVCVAALPAVESHRVAALNEACGELTARCGIGSVCRTSPGLASGVCIEEAAGSPKVLSVRFDGMQQDQGWYRAEPETAATITVQAVNAMSASVYLEPYADATTTRVKLIDLERKEGGTFTGTFKVPLHLNAEMDVIVRDGNGQFSGMSVKVAATK
jgi:hypothetical protein